MKHSYGVASARPNLQEGFDGSSVREGPNHSTIEIWYDTHQQAMAAHTAFLNMMDACGVPERVTAADPQSKGAKR